MTALRVTRAALVAVVLVLTVGTATAGAQTAPSLTTDAPQYLPGATITVTGTGYPAQCTAVNLNTFPGFTVVTDIAPDANGGFTATFTAPTTLGSYELSSQQSGVAGCGATTTFEVVTEITTTTTTTTTGPTTTSGGPTTSSSVAASSSAATTALARTGSNPGLLVAAGIAIAIGLVFVAASRRRSVS
jgi:LPXTG-motif cell wall-anchored protein